MQGQIPKELVALWIREAIEKAERAEPEKPDTSVLLRLGLGIAYLFALFTGLERLGPLFMQAAWQAVQAVLQARGGMLG